MKYYSFKTNFKKSNYLDKKEWKKHIYGLEKKADALFEYLNIMQPNYSIINWNEYNLPLESEQMYIQNDDWTKGAIYRSQNVDYYFLKCFNNNDLIWGKTNARFINNFPNQRIINQIKSHSEELECFSVTDNTWLLIDKNTSTGYRLLNSSSGYGGIYTIKWMEYYTDTTRSYYLRYDLINNGKNVTTMFFNNPWQTRWNLFETNMITKSTTISNSCIKNTENEFYQGQKQLMHKIYLEKKENQQTRYESVCADYTHQEEVMLSQQKLIWKLQPIQNLGVYYW